MTPERLAELEQLANQATPGPWIADIHGPDGAVDVIACDGVYGTMEAPDAEFIAAARIAVPELLDEVRRLQGVSERLRRIANGWRASASDLADDVDKAHATLARVRQLCEDYAMEPEQTPGYTDYAALFSTMRAYENVLRVLNGEDNFND